MLGLFYFKFFFSSYQGRYLALSCAVTKDNLILGLDKVVNDRVQEDSSNTDGATNQLDGGEGFSQDQRDTDNDNHTLGSVGNRLGHSTSLLECHCGEFIVTVEEEAGCYQVDPESGGGLEQFHEFSKSRSFLGHNEGNTEEETKNGGNGKLVSNGSNAVLEAFGFHELLVFVTTDSGEHVGNASRDKGRPGEIQFLDGGQDNSTNNNGQARPLGLGHLLSVDELGKDGSKGRFGGLNNLSERDSTHTHGEDRGTVGSHEAECNRQHFDNIRHGDLGLFTGIGGQPKEDTVQAANTQLQT
mmetsp:Transcript_11420/g.25427  ORF Transcript_11420/g.25427 Transcript_11420/m.25427 type:complete len:299 (+) Transcript_11420:206-1102(+)